MRPIAILYILAFYVLFQFCWWAYLLTELNQEIYSNKIELVTIKATSPAEAEAQMVVMNSRMQHRQYMVIGEGFVFLSLLLWGSLVTYRSFRREFELARLQKNFLLSVTHEFKSPLAAIKLYLETMQRHELDVSKQQIFIKNALYDTDRLNQLVENALMANLIDRQNNIFTFEDFDLSAKINDLAIKFSSVPGFPKIESTIAPGIIIYGDANAITILVTNLIENASKYTASGETIGLKLSNTGKYTFIEVADQGIGIPDDEKEKVFQKFYRAGNEETRSTKGTGLGLYLSRYIARKHQGDIKILDNQPKGAIFQVRLNKTV